MILECASHEIRVCPCCCKTIIGNMLLHIRMSDGVRTSVRKAFCSQMLAGESRTFIACLLVV